MFMQEHVFVRPEKRIWQIVDCEVRRHGVPIAQAVKVGENWGWKWIGEMQCYRVGFATKAEILPDVKYFHRYNPPRLTVTLKSGRKVVYR